MGGLTVRESTLHRLNYAMIVAILVTLAVHLATHAFLGVTGYEGSLTYDSVIGRYRALSTMAVLAVLLVAASCHGLYGLRNMLLEMRHGPRWDRAVTLGVLALGVVMVGWGVRTIVFASAGV